MEVWPVLGVETMAATQQLGRDTKNFAYIFGHVCRTGVGISSLTFSISLSLSISFSVPAFLSHAVAVYGTIRF